MSELQPEPQPLVQTYREKPLKLLRRYMEERSRLARIKSINWLETKLAPKLPNWMLTAVRAMDKGLQMGYENYKKLLKMPHLYKVVWALMLFCFGCSGFCVRPLI